MNNTKELFHHTWQLLINFFVVVIILILFFCLNFSISSFIFNIKDDDFALAVDLAILSPLFTVIFVVLYGIYLDLLRNEVFISVEGSDERDEELILESPRLEYETHEKIFIKVEIKNRIKESSFIQVIPPEWLTLQFEENSKAIVEEKNNIYIDLREITNIQNKNYQIVFQAVVMSNGPGKNKNEMNFEKRAKNIKVRYKLHIHSISFKQEVSK
ncbi:hypothetical protein ACWEWU_13130 [Staphylococcus xylosus]